MASRATNKAVEVDKVEEIEDELGKAVDQNGSLRSALESAKETISLQDETIKALTEDRYALATVLSFQEMRWREPKKDELMTGHVVKVVGTELIGKIVSYSAKSAKYKVEFFDGSPSEEFYGNSSKKPNTDIELLLWRPAVARVAYDNKVLELPVRPPTVYKAGQAVRIQMETFQICSAATEELVGEVARVQRRLDEQTCEVSSGPSSYVVRCGGFAMDALEDGDMVALDRSGQVIVRKLGKSGDEYLFNETTGVSWDDIGGAEQAKRDLREGIELPPMRIKMPMPG